VEEEVLLAAHIFECEIGSRNLIIETGKLATQAGAAVTVTYGETVVLVTGCVAEQPREGVDFLPLTVDYEERLYAAGKIPGGFIRREGRPSQEATLTSRLTDRPLRPLLPKGWRRDIQLIITVLSADQENDPDILALIGSSAVLSMSEVPFAGPVGAVHVGYINNELVLNPTMVELEGSELDLVVASTKDVVAMVEAGASELSEEIMLRAIEFGHEANQAIIRIQEELQQACGNPKEEAPAGTKVSPEVTTTISPVLDARLDQALYQPDKPHREHSLDELKKEIVEQFGEQFTTEELKAAFEEALKTAIRSNILKRGQRPDGRNPDEVRPLNCETGLLPRTHGSALFSRGLTQVLTIATLGSVKKEQMLDGLGIEESKRFMHHYNFPPFSVGEVRRIARRAAVKSVTVLWPSGPCCQSYPKTRTSLTPSVSFQRCSVPMAVPPWPACAPAACH